MSISKCMNKYKSEFTIKFARLMQENLIIWQELQKIYRKKLYTTDILWYLIGFAAGFIPGKHETNYFQNLEIHFWLGIGIMIFCIFTAIAWENKEYQNEIKKTLFQKLLVVFGKNIFYSGGNMSQLYSLEYLKNRTEEEIEETQEALKQFSDGYYPGKISDNIFENSDLYPRKITSRDDDDCFYGIYNKVKFTVNETDFGWNSNDKHRTYHCMFKGVAMRFQMNKKINTKVLIHSKSIFNYLPKGFEKVELESSDFSKKYGVYVRSYDSNSEGQIEARYLLNTAFIDRFLQLKTSFRASAIKLSVKDDLMLVMLSTKRDLFEMNHLLQKIDDVRQYEHLFDEFASILSFMDVLNLSSKTGL